MPEGLRTYGMKCAIQLFHGPGFAMRVMICRYVRAEDLQSGEKTRIILT